MCFAHRSDIEKVGKSYKLHLDHDHNYWKYNNYISYLSQKNKEDLTGQEGKVWDLYQAGSTQWIPIAKSLEQIEEEEAAAVKDARFSRIEERVTECTSLLKEVKEKLDAMEKERQEEKMKEDLKGLEVNLDLPDIN
jgi:hypothetical protein